MRQRHLCHSLKILLHRWPQVTELPRETLCRPCHITVSTRAHTRIYIFIPSFFFTFFFFSPEFACAAHVLCSQCLGCSAQCWSTSTATTHKRGTPQRFAISEILALLETYNRLGPPQLDLPSCMHCLPNWAPLCKPLYPSAPLQ